MKAIFLDIDGVIATPTSVRLNYLLGRGPELQYYDTVSMTYLGRLVARSDAIVVLSSNWRLSSTSNDPFTSAVMDNLYCQLAAVGAPVSDVTPSLTNGDRSCEISQWLNDHHCDTWVIIDDLAQFDDRPEVAEGHLVIIDDSGGIRWQHFYQALTILQGAHTHKALTT